ncbi:MAG: nitroreductase family protein, partial [Azonexus sp.]
PMTLEAIGLLFELSFALSAWKQYGPDRWAMRVNPSSGNLHPTEAWLVCKAVANLNDGVHHYAPREHALEQRATFAPPPDIAPATARALVALTSIQWREAWKYGERAFRYCQLDVGHATGALGYAAALLGWEVEPLALTSENLQHCLGLDRPEDFPPSRYAFTETEEPEILLAVRAEGLRPPPAGNALDSWLKSAEWQGRPSRIDASPGYRWPAINQAAAASREISRQPAPPDFAALPPLPPHPSPAGAAALIRQRRSGQRFSTKHTLPKAAFYRMLDALLPRQQAPWLGQESASRIHLLLFVLRVDGLPGGLYLLPRTPAAAIELPAALAPADSRFAERRPVSEFDADCPPHLGLIQLCTMGLQELQRLARSLSCHQDIASSSAFSLGMLGEFDAATADDGHGYRELLREAGLLGQALYLEAEAAGLRGTGIGCFFDDPVHQLCGLDGARYQSVYHFTVGTPISDERIETGPPYPQRHQETS